ncbi:SPOR domain-containing protein [Laribacter hongkongensis]|uniref:SPOR domain-containing protein n=1 Tax=Laribacter hongkongensis TaxID=168471 RepID=UPI001EFE7086|nr:SPOR domain-containing protein [Laribacter hongkongensis]MCG9031518.1 SPOR domain-containing protein [Laribacter hongkongensis]MCG9090835.1 SPOR domain-containing protein [Laribacter hongkongensis]
MIESRNQQELILLRKRARRRLVGAVALVSVSTVLLWKVVDSQPQLDIRPERIEVVSLGPQAPASVPAAPPVAAEQPGVPSAEQDLPPVSEPVTTNPEPTRPEDVKLPPPPVVPPVKAEPPKVMVKPDVPAASPRPARDPAAILNGLADFDESGPLPTSKPAHKPAVAAKAEVPPAAGKAVPAAKGGRFVIQVAALSEEGSAESLKKKLAAAGVSASVTPVQTAKGVVHRVRVGPFASEAEAEAALRKIHQAGQPGILVPQ